jgi:hypothetical protein
MFASTLGELFPKPDVVISVHRRQWGDVRRREEGEHMSQVARILELDDVSQQKDQIDVGLGEPGEGRVGPPVEVLGLEGVDPA